jgi:UDP:flavonoid glycosyltransferase YjiC (YdhE family)
LPKDVFTIDYVPYDWLFPRAKCIVHHGGSGTAGAVFRSGVPSVFVPHGSLFDQYYWGKLAQELGCACQPITFSELTADRLTDAINSIIESPDYYTNAGRLGRQIRSEPGVKMARQLIEELHQKTELSRRDWDSRTSAESLDQRRQRSTRRKEFQHHRRSFKT